MVYLGQWLQRQPWYVQAAFWLFFDIVFAVGVVRGAFFYHHDTAMLWFAPIPVAMTAYLVHLVRSRPARPRDDVPETLSKPTRRAIFVLTLGLIGLLSILDGTVGFSPLGTAVAVIVGVIVVAMIGLLLHRRWPPDG